jgi:hypothetical protein
MEANEQLVAFWAVTLSLVSFICRPPLYQTFYSLVNEKYVFHVFKNMLSTFLKT